ncbi:MAG: AsmA family protein [Deltaproteobacteria bacterium]|jgi:uncharacterized protein involved in outer membrane biogenesis|nr:AsmA family protein [Deltaproteobacteria bacterium]
MKKVLIAGVVIIVVIVGIIFLTLSNLGPIVKKAVNTVGPNITKTDVIVADVSVSLLSGEAKVKDFFLGNPKGFKSAQAMRVGSVYVDIDESSITKNPIIINKIEIIAPEITYEKIKGSDNFQALLKNVQSSANAEKKAQSKPESKEGEAKKIVINNVIVKDGKVNLTMAALGGKEVTAPLPDIHLKDIGKEKQGATPAEAFEKIFASLYGNITADSVTAILNDGLKQMGAIQDLGEESLKTGGETAQKILESSSKDIKSATEGLKGLFKKE